MAIIKMKEYSPTHRGLVNRISLYFKNVRRATVVMAELSTAAGETPDVMAWFGGAYSVLIECKVSRSDFLADKHKHFRRYEENGVGNERYFAAPKGIINPEEVPEGWGLLVVDEHYVREAVKPKSKQSNKSHECIMLMSALRRLEISTAVFVRQDTEIEERENLKHATSASTPLKAHPNDFLPE